eukprot:2739680-Amphidinium_carterae.1
MDLLKQTFDAPFVCMLGTNCEHGQNVLGMVVHLYPSSVVSAYPPLQNDQQSHFIEIEQSIERDYLQHC